jgi:hypothetical protein
MPLLVTTLDSRAWRELSHGARSLYIALKRHVPRGRNTAFISYRNAQRELGGAHPRDIAEWFRELQHYGFIVMHKHGSLGVEGKGKAPHWRLTELGCTRNASSDGLFEPPSNDFLKWAEYCLRRKNGPAPTGFIDGSKNRIPLPTRETVRFQRGKDHRFQRRKRFRVLVLSTREA